VLGLCAWKLQEVSPPQKLKLFNALIQSVCRIKTIVLDNLIATGRKRKDFLDYSHFSSHLLTLQRVEKKKVSPTCLEKKNLSFKT
jgi:hypothetical protein